jgi:CheY-like chemotaxis protein
MKEGTGTILIVDDEDHDIEFLQRALKRSGVNNPVRTAGNGEEAIAYLTGQGNYTDRLAFPFPRVIITDLKMPHMGGLELLRWLHDNPKFKVVPTIVFTSSTSQADVDEAFKRGASGYFVKPVDFDQLEQMAKVLADYWKLSLVPMHD